MTDNQLLHGILSGERHRSFDDVNARSARMAGGLQALGVKPGDCVCVLMRNDIAFLEAAYAVMTVGAYMVPVNWHFKQDELAYVLGDTGTRVLIGHADLLHEAASVLPAGVTMLSAATPPEILANYKIAPEHRAAPAGAIDLETWLAQQRPYDGPALPQPQNMIYTSGTTGHPKGVKRFAPTP